jgi:hypothetical protein
MAPSGARPGRVFDDEGGNTERRKGRGGEGAEPPVLRYVIVNNYRTIFDDFRELYLFDIQVDKRLTEEAGL